MTLLHKSAHDFEEIEPEAFDTVVINSVAQYFPSIDYLVRVLEGAVQAWQPGGSVFVGDVRSLPLLEAYHTPFSCTKLPHRFRAETTAAACSPAHRSGAGIGDRPGFLHCPSSSIFPRSARSRYSPNAAVTTMS